jgi:site-specific recombinase XerD
MRHTTVFWLTIVNTLKEIPMTATHPIAPYMEPFFCQYLGAEKGASRNTLVAYRDTVKLLLCFAADALHKPVDRLTVEDLDEQRVLAFLDALEGKRGCSPRTRNARLAALRTFFDFIARRSPELLLHVQRIRGIAFKNVEHREIDYLQEDEIQAVLRGVDVQAREGCRDKALLMLLNNTGARVSEVCGLMLEDVRRDPQLAQVRLQGKGRRERACPLWPETVASVEAYLKVREPQDAGERRLFLNANGRPMTRFGVGYLTKKYTAKAAAQCPSLASKRLSPHSWRHSTAMQLMHAGIDIAMIAIWLGHASVNTAHKYSHLDMKMKRDILEKSPKPGGGKAKRSWQRPSTLKWLDALTNRL